MSRSSLTLFFAALFSACVALMAMSTTAEALPRMTMMAGAPCATCHVTPQGGGMRNELGWGVGSMIGAVEYEDIGLGFITDLPSNEIIEELVSIGIDARIQVARLGRPTVTVDDTGNAEVSAPPRRVIPMQIQPYLAITPHETLTLYGTYAAGPNTFRGELCDTPYPGQSCYEAQVIYRPSPALPSIRAGMLQPTVGIRHDDHTMLIRGDAAAPRGSLIPPNYAELGGELSYQPRYWFHAEAGAFRASNLSRAIGNEVITTADDLGYNARLGYMPRIDLEEMSLVGWIGVSTLGAGDFRMDHAFIGAGILDRLSIFLEAALLHYGDSVDREGRNLSAAVQLQTWEWLILEGRVEEGQTTLDDELFRTRAAVVGVQFFPLPYIELRPEYRYVRTEEYAMGQYALQMHFYF